MRHERSDTSRMTAGAAMGPRRSGRAWPYRPKLGIAGVGERVGDAVSLRLEHLSLGGSGLLEELLGLGGLGAVVYGPDRRVRWAFGPVPGDDAAGLVGLSCSQVHQCTDAPCDPCLLERAASAGPQRRVIHVAESSDRPARVLEISIGTLGPTEHADAGGWIEVVREIRETEGVLGLIHAGARDILRTLRAWSIPVVIVDADERIVSWNLGASKLYGRSEDKALGQDWTAIADESEVVELPHVPGTRTRRYEARHRGAKDGPRTVMVTRTEIQGPRGENEGAFSLILDVTESKTLEQELGRQVDQLSVIREIAEGLQSQMELHRILRTILVGATAGQGLRFNRAFLLLVDERKGLLRGRDAIGPADADEAARIWTELDARERSLRDLLREFDPVGGKTSRRVWEIADGLRYRLDDGEAFLIRALGSVSTVRVIDGRAEPSGTEVEPQLLDALGVRTFVAVPLIAEGKPVGLMIADNAITHRRIGEEDVLVLELLAIQAALAIERARAHEELARQFSSLARVTEELRQNEERLVRAERLSAIGEMAARVVHEIRNPLAAIGGFARALLRGDEAEFAKREALEIIVDEVRRLESIIRDVLDFSRPPLPRIAPVDLEKLAGEAIELLKWEMEDVGVKGVVEAQAGLPQAPVDRDQLFQAIVNILRNAIHAMPDGGTATVRLRAVPHAVEMTIRDTGHGISPEVKPRVFEPFFTTKAAGSGLGLTIAAQIVRDHRGDIEIDSREGEGASVTLRIPAAKEGEYHGEDPHRGG